MSRYIRRRLVTAIPVFFGITLLVFLLMDLAPGSAAAAIATGNGSTPPSPSDISVIGAACVVHFPPRKISGKTVSPYIRFTPCRRICKQCRAGLRNIFLPSVKKYALFN